jgi:hypothetical protein
MYAIISAESATSEAVVLARDYYADVEFASQLCSDFAAAERSNTELSACFADAHRALHLIVDHNALLKAPPSEFEPCWPRHDSLLRCDVNLLCLTSQFLFTKKWQPRAFVLRGGRMCCSDGKAAGFNSFEASLSFMRSNPQPDGLFCMDLRGAASAGAGASACDACRLRSQRMRQRG